MMYTFGTKKLAVYFSEYSTSLNVLIILFENIVFPRCRAPIASLDCMEEFSAGSAFSVLGDRGNESGGGGITKEQLLLSGLTHSAPAQQLQVARQPSITPGLRYRNLGKSGLRVSNIGLGKKKI